MKRQAWVVAGSLVLGLMFSFGACTNVYLLDGHRTDVLDHERAVTLEGRFCTVGARDIIRPIKILLAMDASQSMSVTDPDGTRARAVIDLFNNLPNDPEIYVSVMLFAGKTTAFLTKSGLPEFEQLISLTDADRLRIIEQLLTFTNPDNSPDRDSTDFVKPLAEVYSVLNRDIATARASALDAGAEALGRYSVIFLSDGHPTVPQDDQLIQGDAVRRIRQLSDLAEDVRLNAVHVFSPAQPIGAGCDFSVDAGGCPLLIVNQDAERLDQMAKLGGGEFRDFRNNEPINFLNFRFGQTRRAFEVKQIVASNFSAPAGSPGDNADTDGDGLTDLEEISERTNPVLADTDGDGFSDGVEVKFARLGSSFNPIQRALPDGGGLDPGCPVSLRGVDSDCDGLFDCDEQLIGTNATRADSDWDGIPDGIEWRLNAQASGPDLQEDVDNDGVTTGEELRMHLDPTQVDVTFLTRDAYRYQLLADGPIDAEGRQCYKFRVDNIQLSPTMSFLPDAGVDGGVMADGGIGAGYNDIVFSVAMVPSDNPGTRTIVRSFRYREARYPVGGIKSPPDGVIRVAPEDLIEGCPRGPLLGP